MNQPEPVISLPLDRIVVGRRLRPVDSDYVALLAASMADSGQHTPIHVGPADAQGLHPLITGAHRVAAARVAGLVGLQAIIFYGDALEAELLEIDENLMRRGLSALDRGVFLARRQEVYLALHPETGRGGNQRKKQNEKFSFWSQAPAFTEATAQKLGLSRRSIEMAIARSRIEPDLRQLLALTRWADHGATLDALLKADEDLRRRLVLSYTNGQAIDITIRVGGPQIERNPAPSSLVLPPVGAPAAATRAADRLTLDVPDGLYDMQVVAATLAAEGTVYPGQALAHGGLGLSFAWPAAALAAGERHLRSLTLRKVA